MLDRFPAECYNFFRNFRRERERVAGTFPPPIRFSAETTLAGARLDDGAGTAKIFP